MWMHLRVQSIVYHFWGHFDLDLLPQSSENNCFFSISQRISCLRRQSLGRGFGASEVHLRPLVAWTAVRPGEMVLLLLTFSLLLLPLWESVVVLCFVRYFMSILVLQSS